MMANFLDAVIQDGPNEGLTIRDLLASNYVLEDGTGVLADLRRTAARTKIIQEDDHGNG